MTQSSKFRRLLPVMAFALPLAVALPVVAQRAGKIDDNQGKQITELVKQGQLGLADAIKLAERHTNGTAIAAHANLEAGVTSPGGARPTPGGPQNRDPQNRDAQERDPNRPQERMQDRENRQDMAGKRLVYDVSTFADGKVKHVRVDAQSRQVIDEDKGMNDKGERPVRPTPP